MLEIFEWPHVVAAGEIDALGHANNEVYLRWMNQAAVAHSAALGWPTEKYLQLGQGWVVRRHEIDYLRPAVLNLELVVRTWVKTFERASSWRCYAIMERQNGVLLARAQTLWVWVNYETGRIHRIPSQVIVSFPVVAEDPLSKEPSG